MEVVTDCPFVFVQQLKEFCQQWMLSDEQDTKGILDLVVSEKHFITHPQARTEKWVQCHQPAYWTNPSSYWRINWAVSAVADGFPFSHSYSLSFL